MTVTWRVQIFAVMAASATAVGATMVLGRVGDGYLIVLLWSSLIACMLYAYATLGEPQCSSMHLAPAQHAVP